MSKYIPLPFLDLSFLQLFPEGNHLSLQVKNYKNEKENKKITETYAAEICISMNFDIRSFS
jgi:hypothetical protein